tara:strand:- start:1092 stop:2000 length:909 start_codon:yes stop_codon:yes gene_type:complete
MLDLSIVIVNYRCWDKLAVCLKSIKMQSVTIRKVIVVDNFSNDGELEIFSNKFNWVHFIKEQVNGGFSYGCNIGAQYANTKWILFLNPDTKIPKTCFENLIPFCDNNPDYRLISINQLGDQGKQTYPFGIFPNFLNVLPPIRSLERILFRPSQSKKVISQNQISFPDWISGSFILIRNDDFTKIGEWDESFWMYYEDIDLCKRAQNNQMKCVMLNQWSCIHSHGGASRKNIDTRIKTKSEVIISSHKYAEKHFKGIGRFIAHILIFISSIIELFIFSLFSKVKRGMFFVMLRYWFLKTTSVK